MTIKMNQHTAPTRSARIRPRSASVQGNRTHVRETYTVHDLSAREALQMAEAMAAKSNTPVRWILWLRGEPWHEFSRSDSFYEWRDGQQVLLVFASKYDAVRFVKYHDIGGDWQPQPYAEATLIETCAQYGWRWRLNERLDPPLIEADAICPLTGEVVKTAWAWRDLSPRPDAELATVAEDVAAWLLTI